MPVKHSQKVQKDDCSGIMGSGWSRSRSEDVYTAETRGTQSLSGSGTQLALVFAALPLAAHVLGASVARLAVEVAVAALLALWTHYMLHAPWRLYLSRRGAGDAAERLYVVLLFATPFCAAYMLHVAQALSGASSVVLGHISAPLFLCAALLRPMTLFLSTDGLKAERAANKECDCASQSTALARLARRLHCAEQRIEHLESVVETLKFRDRSSSPATTQTPLVTRLITAMSALAAMPFRLAYRTIF